MCAYEWVSTRNGCACKKTFRFFYKFDVRAKKPIAIPHCLKLSQSRFRFSHFIYLLFFVFFRGRPNVAVFIYIDFSTLAIYPHSQHTHTHTYTRRRCREVDILPTYFFTFCTFVSAHSVRYIFAFLSFGISPLPTRFCSVFSIFHFFFCIFIAFLMAFLSGTTPPNGQQCRMWKPVAQNSLLCGCRYGVFPAFRAPFLPFESSKCMPLMCGWKTHYSGKQRRHKNVSSFAWKMRPQELIRTHWYRSS